MLIYDGACGFCTRSARWVEHRLDDRREVVAFQRIDDLAALGLTLADVQSAAYWITPRGRARRGHLAIAGALRAIGGVWWPVGALMEVPPFRWLAGVGYRWVANNRHRFGGPPGCADCGSPEPTDAAA